ncbi:MULTISPECIES: DNA sulfur modification protein DndD [unclassified Breznakia]|uniref:DNA sulfur modification protein DndD n=1 Tax=unclassified Breznakia TaxID=2623764 RepID=UPI0024742E93|nr:MULTISPECIES: DNA sulfur modification protein DndD [unclassified Breznakia]MDH6367982.1 DNA sulfur modification protein DndD [Breznakia sp. PH1-1]MDH6405087.1 DNA sulfur modification protein DndD [Breznakia sp. PF1-11]MDH6412785.1 DNA sulfur modification protein DndD [Breznakia sp. PFB1-11]MDH6415162.1 DNA sulfur modification protein DndD [Breznakia sp. PFB1-14]MDH6417473.1 DNA sulfur modification protein DndD [Breznakia sp. PFB1-4]
MKIKSIELSNIGPYTGLNNRFDFSLDENKPITLIGGKNGAGKTTLLSSIKVGLFGSYSFGLSTDGDAYLNKMMKLFNYNVVKSGNGEFMIKVTIKMFEDYRNQEYSIKKLWKLKNNKYVYSEEVVRNGKKLTQENAYSFGSKLKDLLPPQMIDALLFDGEEVAKIISDNNIDEYIKTIFDTTHSFSLFKRLSNDLSVYMKKSSDEIKSKEHIELLETQNIINTAKTKRRQIQSEITYLNNDIKVREQELSIKRAEFEKIGGLTNNQKRKLEEIIKDHEQKRKRNSIQLKDYLENKYLYSINIDILKELKDKLDQNKPKAYLHQLKVIKEYLGTDELDNTISLLESKTLLSTGLLDVSIESRLVELIEEIETVSSKEMLNDQKKLSSLFSKNKDANKIINNNELSDEINQAYAELSNISVVIDLQKDKIHEKSASLDEIERNLDILYKKSDLLERKVMNITNEKGSFKSAYKIQKTINLFLRQATQKELFKIERAVQRKFEEVNKKKNYISKVSIDPTTFSLELFDSKQQKIEISFLSAGEKQLLLATIIWVIFDNSNKDEIFIFDTPLARLDSENRELYIKNIVSTISNQIIILSTDEEFVGSNYSLIENSIGNSYHLDNDPEAGKTYIKEGYFSEVNK